jgi:histone acetyltransferase (RNA polymerase elongator complex component)
MIVPIFLPHLGCKNRCIYCDQDIILTLEQKIYERGSVDLARQKGPFEVGLYGGNIFGLKPEAAKRLFSFFERHQSEITNFRISTKPIPLDREIINILKENRVTTIELGIPTFNDQILELLNRGHTAADLINAFNTLTGEGFQVALQVLPAPLDALLAQSVPTIIILQPCCYQVLASH